MGKRSRTETVAAVMVRLLIDRTAGQAAIARHAGIESRAAARVLRELQQAGIPVGVHGRLRDAHGFRLKALRELVLHVSHLVEPAALFDRLGPDVPHRAQKPRARSPTATAGARIPRSRSERSTEAQLSVLLR